MTFFPLHNTLGIYKEPRQVFFGVKGVLSLTFEKCMNKQNTPAQQRTSISARSASEGEEVHFLYDGGKL